MERCCIFCYNICFCHFCLLPFHDTSQADIIYLIINFVFSVLTPLVGRCDGNVVCNWGLFKEHLVDPGSVTSGSANVEKQFHVDFTDENSIVSEISL